MWTFMNKCNTRWHFRFYTCNGHCLLLFFLFSIVFLFIVFFFLNLAFFNFFYHLCKTITQSPLFIISFSFSPLSFVSFTNFYFLYNVTFSPSLFLRFLFTHIIFFFCYFYLHMFHSFSVSFSLGYSKLSFLFHFLH